MVVGGKGGLDCDFCDFMSCEFESGECYCDFGCSGVWGQPLTVSIVCIASALVFIWNERRKGIGKLGSSPFIVRCLKRIGETWHQSMRTSKLVCYRRGTYHIDHVETVNKSSFV
jgi:hypothetical protein